MGGLDKNDTVKNFLRTLAENNRLGILQDVCEKFVTLMGAARGEMDLVVTSASVCSIVLLHSGITEPFLTSIRNLTAKSCKG